MDRLASTYNYDTEIIDEENASNSLKSIVIIGDGILNNINPREICKEGNVKISSYPDTTSEDMKDFLNPTI